MIGLYIHIPFCKSLCYYCDFPKLINQKEDVIEAYLDKLCSDIDKLREKKITFDTLYIGGGTPNCLKLGQLKRLFAHLSTLEYKESCEKNIEANFEYLDRDKILLFKEFGINRISIGLQTFATKAGRFVNRLSNYELLKEKVNILKDLGLDNYNFDLIYSLPYQTLDDVKNDLALALSLKPKHISYYSLIYEEKTVLDTLEYESIGEDDELLMEHYINKTLKEQGFKHYEISNYALEGYESKHNMLYWTKEEYIGLGLAATSYYQNKRYTNSKILKEYLNDLNVTYDEVTNGEYFMLGLRMLDGVSLSRYKEMYHEDPFEVYDINYLLNNDLIIINDDIIKLSDKGLNLANQVFVKFI